MEKGHPLPTDMRWAADDPRWDDLSVETVWDRFVREAVDHYRGRSMIFEIENEPSFDHWTELKAEYARFTIRTAKLIRRTDPEARIMVNNVYGIPSAENAVLLQAGGAQYIDVMSWHDYHEGWLADAPTLRRMRQNLDEAGGEQVEIWFNEGWAFTNTAVDEPIACTGLTSAQSVNAIIASVAELTANGQEKTILFHTASETHGMSFWDYSGPGTMLWDWYNYPLPLVAAWNVLNHHVGLSRTAGFVRPPGANLCLFDDLRNGRGVAVVYADRDAGEDVELPLPDLGLPLTVEDLMGNPAPAPAILRLSKTGRPVYLYGGAALSGSALREAFAPLDRKHAGFVSGGDGGATQWRLPPVWEGTAKGSPAGSTVQADGKPVWILEQVWPPEGTETGHYRPMVWTGTDWNVAEHGLGGQPGAALDGRALKMGTRAPHGDPPRARTCGLSFVAPRDGTYRFEGTVASTIWDGNNATDLQLLHRSASGIREAARLLVPHREERPLKDFRLTLAAGEVATLLPRIQGMYSGGDCVLKDLTVVRTDGGADAAPASGPVYRLPLAWAGQRVGEATGNPVRAHGHPVWRLDRVYPDDAVYAANYLPMPWDGTAWHPQDHQQGGQPSATVENGTARLSVSGPWQNNEFQKLAALVFLTPESGVYRVSGTAHTKPWTGGAETFRLSVMKKDTQRAVEVAGFDLPKDDTPVPVTCTVELTAGHELVFLPRMPQWNNATTVVLEDLRITREP